MIYCIAIDYETIALDVIKAHASKVPSLSLKATFSSPVQAIEFIKGEPVDLILLDINMPRMNGLEFLAELRKDASLKHLSVYMVTTSNDEADVKGAHEFNVAGYILMPVDIQQFENTFRILGSYWQICEFPQ